MITIPAAAIPDRVKKTILDSGATKVTFFGNAIFDSAIPNPDGTGAIAVTPLMFVRLNIMPQKWHTLHAALSHELNCCCVAVILPHRDSDGWQVYATVFQML